MVKTINKGLDKSIITSLDGDDVDLLPFIPYLLKDLTEIGSSSESIIKLIRDNSSFNVKLNVLDLGCGKGGVAVALAKEFGWNVTGIDAVPEFIAEALKLAQENNISDKCRFIIGDIREYVAYPRDFDLVVLGSIGPVLGNQLETLKKVQNCLKPKGFVILDDGYVDNLDKVEEYIPFKDDFYKQIRRSHFKIIDQIVYESNFMEDENNEIYSKIVKRAKELISKYPSKEKLFLDYLQNQSVENEKLTNDIICLTLLLQL